MIILVLRTFHLLSCLFSCVYFSIICFVRKQNYKMPFLLDLYEALGAGVIPRQLVPRATFHRQAFPRPVKS